MNKLYKTYIIYLQKYTTANLLYSIETNKKNQHIYNKNKDNLNKFILDNDVIDTIRSSYPTDNDSKYSSFIDLIHNKITDIQFCLYVENEKHESIRNYIILLNDNIVSTMTKYSIKYNKQYDVNVYNYDHMISLIDSNDSRKQLEMKFYDIDDKIINNFAKLVIAKNQLAIKNNYSNYGEYVRKNIDFNAIDILLQKIVDDLTSPMNIICSLVSKELNIQSISNADITYWFYKKQQNYFSVNDVITMVQKLCAKCYNVTITYEIRDDIWDASVKVLRVRDSSVNGLIFLDLIKRKNKISFPTAIPTEHTDPAITLIAGYDDYESKKLSLHDAIFLFKQFGQIIHYIFSSSSTEDMYLNEDVCDIMSRFMEYMFWHVFDHPKNKYIEYVYKLEKIKHLYISSIDALFDILIHTNNRFAEVCNMYIKDEQNINAYIKSTYSQLFANISHMLTPVYSKINMHINPIVISNIVNNSQCSLYNSILNHIIGMNLANFAIQSRDNSIKTLLQQPMSNHKKNIANIASKYSINFTSVNDLLQYIKQFSVDNQNVTVVREKINKNLIR